MFLQRHWNYCHANILWGKKIYFRMVCCSHVELIILFFACIWKIFVHFTNKCETLFWCFVYFLSPSIHLDGKLIESWRKTGFRAVMLRWRFVSHVKNTINNEGFAWGFYMTLKKVNFYPECITLLQVLLLLWCCLSILHCCKVL